MLTVFFLFFTKRGVNRNRVDDVHKNNVSDDEIENEVIQLCQGFENIGIATVLDAETQTGHFDETNIITSTHMHMKWSHSKILICILADFFPSFNAIRLRVLSMIVYVTLRLENISYERVGEIFKELNLNGVSNCVV